jgi:hypothetical protein
MSRLLYAKLDFGRWRKNKTITIGKISKNLNPTKLIFCVSLDESSSTPGGQRMIKYLPWSTKPQEFLRCQILRQETRGTLRLRPESVWLSRSDFGLLNKDKKERDSPGVMA